MSAEDQSGAGRREVAYRVFATEFDDAEFEHSEDDDERAPNYVVTPTGARVNRLFVVGVLTEVEPVNEEMLRARVVDPTGAFVTYAGQYQPDAQTFLERADPPQFVAVTGKARTFEPEDDDVIYTSIRPETINEVDAETRDRWTVQTARHTLERIGALVDALERPDRGDDLRAALESEGVDTGLASGIALAIEYYDTTTGYLDALRGTAIQAAEVVADEREEVEPLDLAPDEGGETEIDVDADLVGTAERGTLADATGSTGGEVGEGESETTDVTATAPDEGRSDTADATESADATTSGSVASDSDESAAGSTGTDSAADLGEGTEPDTSTDQSEDLGDFDAYGTDEGTESGAETSDEAGGEAVATDEMYEFDEEERREIEEEYGTEFSTGTEVEEPDESDLNATTPGAETETDTAGEPDATDEETETEPATDESRPDKARTDETASDPSGGVSDEDGDEASEAHEPEEETAGDETADEPAEDVDLEDVVMETMDDLDDGDGADRDDLIETVAEEYGADPGEVEDAIQEALMSGKCYEPGDDRLKAI